MHSKGNYQQNKKKPMESEKILANYATNKMLISKIYRQLIQHNIKTKTKQLNNGQKTE